MNSVITAEKLSKSLRVGFWGRQKQILHDISFKVPKGSIVGFIGPNGAGKSTTIKLLLGAMKPTHGTLKVLGMPPGATRAKAKVGYLPEIKTYRERFVPSNCCSFILNRAEVATPVTKHTPTSSSEG